MLRPAMGLQKLDRLLPVVIPEHRPQRRPGAADFGSGPRRRRSRTLG
jgi:hypothetical protein